MNANKQLKVAVVKEIEDKINNSSSVVVANYAGLTVAEFQNLRKELKEFNVDIKVYKNRLFKVAAKNAGFEDINANLVGSNVYAFGNEDAIAPAKVMAKFAKDNSKLELVAGIFEGKAVDKAGIELVATLPSFEEALTMLAMQLMSPVKFIGVGLHQLIEENKLPAEGKSE